MCGFVALHARGEDAPVDAPKTRYAKAADGAYLAYQTVGEGPIDLVWQLDWFGNLDVIWEWPIQGRFFTRLASFSRLILHDRRGTGLSSRNVPVPDLETRVADLHHVLDEVAAERVVLGADGEGGAPNVLFATTNPERVRSLIWYAPTARATPAPGYPWGEGPEDIERERLELELWGTEEYGAALLAEAPWFDIEGHPMSPGVIAKLSRQTATPDVAQEMSRLKRETDIRNLLPAVQVPTLLLAHESDILERTEAEHIASLMPTAQLAVVPGTLATADLDDDLTAIQTFLGVEGDANRDRVLATVLFTDIVNSTAFAAKIGDVRWRALIEEHDRKAREIVDRYRGTFVHGTGDGMLATFDGPARAVRCAQAFVEAARSLGVEVRAGAHTGEISRRGDDLSPASGSTWPPVWPRSQVPPRSGPPPQ